MKTVAIFLFLAFLSIGEGGVTKKCTSSIEYTSAECSKACCYVKLQQMNLPIFICCPSLEYVCNATSTDLDHVCDPAKPLKCQYHQIKCGDLCCDGECDRGRCSYNSKNSKYLLKDVAIGVIILVFALICVIFAKFENSIRDGEMPTVARILGCSTAEVQGDSTEDDRDVQINFALLNNNS